MKTIFSNATKFEILLSILGLFGLIELIIGATLSTFTNNANTPTVDILAYTGFIFGMMIPIVIRLKKEERKERMYKVHKFELKMTEPEELEKFLNSIKGEIIAIIPTHVYGISGGYTLVDFVLIVEKVN